MKTIEEKEIAERLATLGYLQEKTYPDDWKDYNILLLQKSIEKGCISVSSYLNRTFESLPEEIRSLVIEIICAEFLDSKRDIGLQEDGTISQVANIKKIQEEQLKVEYDTSSSTAYRDVDTPFDKMIKYLRNTSYQALSPYRNHYAYHQWFNVIRIKELEKEEKEKKEDTSLKEALYGI